MMLIFCSVTKHGQPVTSQTEVDEAVRQVNPAAEPSQDEGDGLWSVDLGAREESKLERFGSLDIALPNGVRFEAEMP